MWKGEWGGLNKSQDGAPAGAASLERLRRHSRKDDLGVSDHQSQL